MELVKGEKYEKISITLMNCLLDKNLDNTSDQYFQVQPKYHIF